MLSHNTKDVSPKLEQSVLTGMIAAFIAYWEKQIDLGLLLKRLEEAGCTKAIEANQLYTLF